MQLAYFYAYNKLAKQILLPQTQNQATIQYLDQEMRKNLITIKFDLSDCYSEFRKSEKWLEERRKLVAENPLVSMVLRGLTFRTFIAFLKYLIVR